MDKITEIIGFINSLWKDEHIPYEGSIFHLFILRANKASKSNAKPLHYTSTEYPILEKSGTGRW